MKLKDYTDYSALRLEGSLIQDSNESKPNEKRVELGTNLCVLCNEMQETTTHLSFSCKISKRLWEL